MLDAGNNDETIEFVCPGCNETSTLPVNDVGEFMPCPACGLSVAIHAESPAITAAASTAEERAFMAQRESSRAFLQSNGLMRVKFRVFRLPMFETWEGLFGEAANFANSLAPEALINISHSGGEKYGAHAVTVWYWQKQPVDVDG